MDSWTRVSGSGLGFDQVLKPYVCYDVSQEKVGSTYHERQNFRQKQAIAVYDGRVAVIRNEEVLINQQEGSEVGKYVDSKIKYTSAERLRYLR